MLSALTKAFAQLPDPKLTRVLAFGVIFTLLSYAALVALAWWALAHTHWFETGWLETGSHLLADVAALLLPLPFFPAVATMVMSFRLEQVAEAVEERHYPSLNWPRQQKWAEVLATTSRFLVVTLAINLLALPVYVASFFFGIGIVLMTAINGYLLGREYFELVALRWLRPAEAKAVRRRYRGNVWLSGVVIAILFSVPVLNFFAPLVATAFMVHRFQALRPKTEGV